MLGGLLSLIFLCIALYLSYRCNDEEISVMGILGALIFGPLYIAYKLATSWDECGFGDDD